MIKLIKVDKPPELSDEVAKQKTNKYEMNNETVVRKKQLPSKYFIVISVPHHI